ncbi:MAG: 3-hydroxyisobutyrate dehydrogenase [Acidisphaera sp.]|nr:3-hydroxyisobutyrate dehydrogenase [Acidisphaera sp.]
MPKIAFIGLGNMGRPMAANLMKAGHEVAGYDVIPEALAAHQEDGGHAADSARSAADGADVVISMLPAGLHVRGLYIGPDGLIPALQGAKPTPLLIDCSTIDFETAREVAAAAAAAGIEMLDAPVSGGTVGAAAGTLTFMVGGSAEGFTRGRPVLERMGRNTVHAGPAGAGQAAKMCNNLILGVSMMAVCEAFVLADRLGLDRQKLFEISATSSGQCWSLTTYCPVPGPVPASPANRDYAPGFTTALMLKDLQLSQQSAESNAAPTPLAAHATRLYKAMADAGLAANDFSVAFRWLSGVTRESLVPGGT